MSAISITTVTLRRVDLTATVTLMGYENSQTASGLVNISVLGQIVHSQELKIDGDITKPTVETILDSILKDYRQTEKHQELFKHFKSIAQEYYPIFDGNDPYEILDTKKPGFSSMDEVNEWASREFPEGLDYAILNEYGQLCSWEKVRPKKT